MSSAAYALCALLAEMSPEEKVARDERTWIWALVLVGTLLVGAIIFSWLEKWRKRQLMDTTGPADQLTSFRALYEAGELSKEEYDRLRTQVARQTKEKMLPKRPGAPAPPVPPVSKEPNPPQSPEQPG